MCEECGCHGSADIDEPVLKHNNMVAVDIRKKLTDDGILTVNMMGSPGSGKTTVIEGLVNHLDKGKIAVIQGDLESTIDRERLEAVGVETFQINTHSGCHLNADMIDAALSKIKLGDKEFLIIENVGNLVCPADVDIGAHLNILVSSTTEGSDKPQKYPIIFHKSNVIIISKTDLAKAVEFNETEYVSEIKKINSNAKIIKTTSLKPETFKEIADTLEHKRQHLIGGKHHH